MPPLHVSPVPLEFTDIFNLCVEMNSSLLWIIHHNFTASKRTQLMANLPYTPIVSPNFTFHYPTVSVCTNRGCVVTRATNFCLYSFLNPLKPNDHYSGRTAPLSSKSCILYIYSTNIGTEYFKHGIHSPIFSLQNAVCFIILTHLVPVLFTFYIQVC
jgi:hypothetical protein